MFHLYSVCSSGNFEFQCPGACSSKPDLNVLHSGQRIRACSGTIVESAQVLAQLLVLRGEHFEDIGVYTGPVVVTQ